MALSQTGWALNLDASFEKAYTIDAPSQMVAAIAEAGVFVGGIRFGLGQSLKVSRTTFDQQAHLQGLEAAERAQTGGAQGIEEIQQREKRGPIADKDIRPERHLDPEVVQSRILNAEIAVRKDVYSPALAAYEAAVNEAKVSDELRSGVASARRMHQRLATGAALVSVYPFLSLVSRVLLVHEDYNPGTYPLASLASHGGKSIAQGASALLGGGADEAN